MIYDEIPDEPTLEEALFNAVERNDIDRASYLLLGSPWLDRLDPWGMTLLQNCTSYEMVELLIEHGADPEQLDAKGRTVWKTASQELLDFLVRVQLKVAFGTLNDVTPEVGRSDVRRL